MAKKRRKVVMVTGRQPPWGLTKKNGKVLQRERDLKNRIFELEQRELEALTLVQRAITNPNAMDQTAMKTFVAKRTVPAPVVHLAFIQADPESIRRGGSCRTAACVCGWQGMQRATLEMACDDALRHEVRS